MKLALVCEKFTSRGGLERYVSELASRLAARHDVHVITSRTDARTAALPVMLHRVARLPSGLLNLFWFDRASAAVAARLGADSVLGFGRTTRQDLHRAGGGCHAVYSRTLPVWKRARLKNQAELFLERALYRGGGTRLFVFNSSAIARQAREVYGVAEERTAVIHTPVDSARFHPATPEQRAAARAALGLPPDGPVFLFASLEHRRKGLPALLEAWPRVPAALLIAGAPLSAEHLARTRAPGLAGRVYYAGGGRGMETLCHAADFFVHPTLYDACANTVLQAMACGLVALVSERDGATDHIREGETGFVLRDPSNPDQIARSCAELLALSGEARRRIGAAARETVARLTWDSHTAAWEGMIARLKEAQES